MSWSDEFNAAADTQAWPVMEADATASAIEALPDADDFSPPGTFWTSAAALVESELGAYRGAKELGASWRARATGRGTTLLDTIDDAGEWAWEKGVEATKEMASAATTGFIAPVASTVTVASAGAKPLADAATAAARAVEKSNNTVRLIGLPLTLLFAYGAYKVMK